MSAFEAIELEGFTHEDKVKLSILSISEAELVSTFSSAAMPAQRTLVVQLADAVVSNASLRYCVSVPRIGAEPARSSTSVQLVRKVVASFFGVP
jgi:hypothetical protein